MEAGPDAPAVLAQMLEELDGRRGRVSCQDLCRSLCARFDLATLARLRSALFRAACLDPAFPAALFRDPAGCPGNGQQSRKLTVAADVVTIFNLLQMTGGAARDKLPAAAIAAGRPEARPSDLARDARRPDGRTRVCELVRGPFGQAFPARCREPDCAECPPFVPASEPQFLLAVGGEDEGARAPYAGGTPQACEMQRTYFPMTLDGASISDQDSLPGPAGGVRGPFAANDEEDEGEEPFGVRSCLQKRTIFREDFHHLLAVSPSLEPPRRKEPPKAPFLNRSFDVPCGSRYLNAPYSPVPNRRRVKHESLDDLQASTYFGPTPAAGTPDTGRRCPGGQPGKQTPRPAKSWSLNAEEVPVGEPSSFSCRNQSHQKLQRYPSPEYLMPPPAATEQQPLLPAGYATADGLDAPGMAAPSVGVVGLGELELGAKVKGTGRQLSSDTSSVGTQTEQLGLEATPRQDLQARHAKAPNAARRPSDDGSEIVSDDISDIFRFLDDVSLSGSTGVVPASYCDSTGSLSQLPQSEGDSSPERSGRKVGAALAKLAGELPSGQGEKGKRGPRRSEEELMTSVCKLVLRIGEIERKLESLSGVRDEISQVLGKLNQLDGKMWLPGMAARGQADRSSLTSGEAPSEESASPRGSRARGAPRGDGGAAGWCCSDVGGSHGESLPVGELKRSLFARPSSRSLTEENGVTASKVASIARSPRDWRTITCASRLSLDREEKGAGGRGHGPGHGKGWGQKPKEADRQHDVPPQQQHRRPKPPGDLLVEQVFSPHPCPASLRAPPKGSPLYTDLRLAELAEVRRGQPPWAGEEYARSLGNKGKLAALDLQTQESLNPNHLEYWMEDIYTPGYDSLLKRKEAEFRRARACKLAALVAAAAGTVVLVIVVPLCTMKA